MSGTWDYLYSKKRKTEINQIGSAFTCAENMVLEALELGISSCIVGRAQETFAREGMQELLNKWGLDPE